MIVGVLSAVEDAARHAVAFASFVTLSEPLGGEPKGLSAEIPRFVSLTRNDMARVGY
ncbi:MAG: hypothetical protein NTX53_20125 [candidate division WOR-3 bacterium]|nr:hypothetical protein [candidate division WOR-3 bacterium]